MLFGGERCSDNYSSGGGEMVIVVAFVVIIVAVIVSEVAVVLVEVATTVVLKVV